MTESSIVTAICQYLDYKKYVFTRINTVGVYDAKAQSYRRVQKYYRRGVPDIILLEPKTGRFIGLEVKTDKGKLSEEQKRFSDDVRGTGAEYWVVRSIDDVEALGL